MKTAITVVMTAVVFGCQAKSGDDATAAGGPAVQPVVTEKKAVTVAPQAKTQDALPAKKPGKGPDTLVITGRLIEIPGEMPPNDLYNYVYVMKYRVVKVENGAYAGPEILVGIYNPLVPRRQITDAMSRNAKGDVTRFKAGDMHHLTLVSPMEKIWNNQVEDDYIDSDLTRYYAARVDVSR
jgi:hypothetical protein